MPKAPNPFALSLGRLRKPTSRRIYRFRRQVKALRAYLALYTFPAEAPTDAALDALYQAAGKLRRAYLIRKALRNLALEGESALRRRLRKRKKQFRTAYKLHKKAIRATLRRWRAMYPFPGPEPSAQQLWQAQAERWVNFLRKRVLEFPEEPADAEAWHELRRILRQWELGAKWVALPQLPPKVLAQLLGDWRDQQALLAWLVRWEVDPLRLAPLRAEIQATEAQLRNAWIQWRHTLARHTLAQ